MGRIMIGIDSAKTLLRRGQPFILEVRRYVCLFIHLSLYVDKSRKSIASHAYLTAELSPLTTQKRSILDDNFFFDFAQKI